MIEHIQTGDANGELVYRVRVVEQYRGRVRYHTFGLDDCEYGMSGDQPNTRSLRSLAQALSADMARDKGADHLAALLVISSITGRS